MTANPNPAPKKPLRIIMPKHHTPLPKTPEEGATAKMSSGQATPSENNFLEPPISHRVWLRRGLIVSGLAAAAFIPTPYWVGGEVTLESTEGQRQAVYAPRGAVVQEIYVNTGDTVSPGQSLVKFNDLELEREITETEEKLTQAQSALERLQVQQVELETKLSEAAILAQSTQTQANRLQNRVTQLKTSSPPPELKALEVRASRLQERLGELKLDIDNYRTLYEAGAMAEKVVRDAESAYQETEKELIVVGEEIKLTNRQLLESMEDQTFNAEYQTAAQQSALKIAEANANIRAYEEMIQVLTERLESLKTQQTSLTVYSTLSGRVLSEDLDLALGQEIGPNTIILKVVNLQELTAKVEVKEDDFEYVNLGAPIRVRVQQSKQEVHEGRVEEISSYRIETDETQQNRIAAVEISIENKDEELRPGSSGYAKIFSKWIPLHKRLYREISKLIPIRFW
ncbi:MAG: efflux RND transporter periplasmic adaptor subunit [Cyanobacteria bacterium P01_D01_bin.156]